MEVTITGHRYISDIDNVRLEIYKFLQSLIKQHENVKATTMLAAGADTIFAQEAIRLGIQLEILLPFALEKFKKDFNDGDRAILEAILESNNYSVHETGYSTAQKNRDWAYLKTSKYLVDKADIVLAVWDGEPANGIGGTAEIVSYANIKRKKVSIIETIRLPDTMQSLNNAYREFDRKAKAYKNKKFQPAWIFGLALGFSGVICFGISITFLREHPPIWLATTEFCLVVVSFLLLSIVAKKWKKLFLDNRRAAEYLRILKCFNEAGLPITQPGNFDYSPSGEILEIEKKLSESQKEEIAFSHNPVLNLINDQTEYHQKRTDKFRKNHERIELVHLGLKIFFGLSISIKLIFEFIHNGYLDLYISHSTTALMLNTCNFFCLIIPPLYAAIEGISYFGDYKLNILISSKIVSSLQKKLSDITDCEDKKKLKIIARSIRKILDAENSQWAFRQDIKHIDNI